MTLDQEYAELTHQLLDDAVRKLRAVFDGLRMIIRTFPLTATHDGEQLLILHSGYSNDLKIDPSLVVLSSPLSLIEYAVWYFTDHGEAR